MKNERVIRLLIICFATMTVLCARSELVLHWPFEEGTGTTTADLSDNNHHGVLSNISAESAWQSADLPPVPSGSSYALYLDGNAQVFAASQDSYKGVTGIEPRTISAWIKPTYSESPIVSWGVYESNRPGERFTFRVQNLNSTSGAIRVEVQSGYIVGTTPVNYSSWHHVLAVLPPVDAPDVNQVRLYVDGELQGVSALLSQSINTASENDFSVGSRFHAKEFYQGWIDEVRLYDHALMPGEINELAGVNDPFAAAVNADEPEAWWRLAEIEGSRAVNEGTVMAPIDGTFVNFAPEDRYRPGLVPTSQNRALYFNGTNSLVEIPNHESLNLASNYLAKTIESWFSTDAFPTNYPQRVIYEQGGLTYGFNQYVERADDQYYFKSGAWSRPVESLTRVAVFPPSYPIATNTAYHAVLTYDSTRTRVLLYLNGRCAGSKTASQLTEVLAHNGDCAIGSVRQNTYADGSINWQTNSLPFVGLIDDVATYNKVLSFERVQEHYIAASGDNMGLRDGITRGVALNYDADNESGSGLIEDSIGTRDQNREAGNHHWNINGVTRVAVADNRLAGVTNAWRFSASSTATANSFAKLIGELNAYSASVEVVFKPAVFSGSQVLLESGGSTVGMTLAVEGTTLRLFIDERGNTADVQFDLNELSYAQRNGFIHAVAVIDIENNKVKLFVNGIQRVETATSGVVKEWSGIDNAGLGCVNTESALDGVNNFEGDIALLRIYPSVLTVEQIETNYLELEPIVPPPGTMIMVR